MRNRLLFACLLCSTWTAPLRAEGIGWRGDGTGRYPLASPPAQWDIDEGTNILWKAKVGKGQSTPVLVGDRVLVTAEPEQLLCLDRRTGNVLWKTENGYDALPPGVQAPASRPPVDPGCGYSTPTPASDGKLVYASYGSGVVVCYELDGRRAWIRLVDQPQVTRYGRTASPLLAQGKLLVSMGGLTALDPRTGQTLWQAAEAKPAYGTPAAARIGQLDVVVTPNGDCVRVSDGRLLARGLGRMEFTSPVVEGDVVYFVGPAAVALKLRAVGRDRIEFSRLWKNGDVRGELYASPVCHEGVLYCVSNQGVLYALDAKTGATLYQKELEIPSMSGAPGTEPAHLYGSPTIAGKFLVVTNDIGHALVLAPGRQYRQIAHNFLDKGSGACPLAGGNVLLLRGGESVYCIGPK